MDFLNSKTVWNYKQTIKGLEKKIEKTEKGNKVKKVANIIVQI